MFHTRTEDGKTAIIVGRGSHLFAFIKHARARVGDNDERVTHAWKLTFHFPTERLGKREIAVCTGRARGRTGAAANMSANDEAVEEEFARS